MYRIQQGGTLERLSQHRLVRGKVAHVEPIIAVA